MNIPQPARNERPSSLFPSRLTLEVDPATKQEDEAHVTRVHFYPSSLTHAKTGETLVSIATSGDGMRITKAQATDLHAWLGEWIAE